MMPVQEPADAVNHMENVVGAAGQDVSAALEGLKVGNFEAALPLVMAWLLPAAGVLLLLMVGYMVAKFVAQMEIHVPFANLEVKSGKAA